MLGRRLGGALAAAALTLLLTTTSASGLSTVTAAGADRGDGVWVGKAQCPAGKRVISGGYSLPGGGQIAKVNKRQGKRAWLVKSPSSDLTVYAYCSGKLRPTIASRTSGFTPSPDVRAKPTAKCPRGKVAVAGGWQYDDAINSNEPVFRSRGTGGRAWSVHAFTDEDSETIKAFAYCLRKGAVKTRSKTSSELEEDNPGGVTVRCPKSQQLLGGGFATKPKSDFFNNTGPDFFYRQSRRVGPRGWRATAFNYGGVAGTITVFALCLK